MINSIITHFGTYNPDEFTPVYIEGELDTKAYLSYKTKSIARNTLNKIDAAMLSTWSKNS